MKHRKAIIAIVLRTIISVLVVFPCQRLGVIYMIGGIPYRKGCLILNCYDLREDRSNPQWDANIH